MRLLRKGESRSLDTKLVIVVMDFERPRIRSWIRFFCCGPQNICVCSPRGFTIDDEELHSSREREEKTLREKDSTSREFLSVKFDATEHISGVGPMERAGVMLKTLKTW
jgi:hypothetical protein